MATPHFSSALSVPAVPAAYPMAKPGYGKRSAPGQQPRTRDDFALLPTRERYIAGFVDHLPEGAEMSIKQLAKQLPLYGQQAISTALNALSVAGHLRRVRCAVGAGDETRWVSRTFWSRTARDNEWWNTYLATENASRATAPTAPLEAPASPGLAAPAEAPAPAAVPLQRTPPEAAPDTAPATALTAPPAAPAGPAAPAPPPAPAARPAAFSPAYLALAELGRKDIRLALSADDCAALEPQAAAWFARGVDADYLFAALTAGLPAQVDCPPRFVRRRLVDKIPPHRPAGHSSPGTSTPAPSPARRLLVECTDCGRPGLPEALPDGLCRPCRAAHSEGGGTPSVDPAEIADVKAHMANIRDLLKAP
ncbi:MarR family transcriptional regulator [Streptomyces sp. CAI-121]|uniref:MarR family transcriptional regulator n=1 Tax=unclassified Streptomyces TaxID=2593676 RepID=UPI0015870351|nr:MULTISPECIES: MarR family transcriptional regulator [unclassified Streptomyces]NUV69030.1 MarR family transcriptional regulator [Streptomyces sp. CAI-121]NUW15107.1 MarR family transcriptional regulator [Streptomyces sp. CAI-68]